VAGGAVARPAAVGGEEPADTYTTVGKGGKAMQFSSDGILKNLQAVQEARGKKVSFCSNYPAAY
jgi:translation initiation factor 3 subunit C